MTDLIFDPKAQAKSQLLNCVLSRTVFSPVTWHNFGEVLNGRQFTFPYVTAMEQERANAMVAFLSAAGGTQNIDFATECTTLDQADLDTPPSMKIILSNSYLPRLQETLTGVRAAKKQ